MKNTEIMVDLYIIYTSMYFRFACFVFALNVSNRRRFKREKTQRAKPVT